MFRVAGWNEELLEALSGLATLFDDDHTVAAYELQSSGIIDTLLNSLNPEDNSASKKIHQERINVFKQAFRDHPSGLVFTMYC